MGIQVPPAVEVVLEAWNRIVAQDYVLVSILDLYIRLDGSKLAAEFLFFASIVVPSNEDLVTLQSAEDFGRTLLIASEHISQDIHSILPGYNGVPPGDQGFVHFLDCLERAIVDGKDVLVTIMPITDVRIRHIVSPSYEHTPAR